MAALMSSVIKVHCFCGTILSKGFSFQDVLWSMITAGALAALSVFCQKEVGKECKSAPF